MAAARVLLAGIGNIFLGDDAFGVEVAANLLARALPEGVYVVDFGIRGIDLAFALERCDAAILIDATERGGAPGTLYVIEPWIDDADSEAKEASPHAMTPARVLRFIEPERRPKAVRLIGCEPASLGGEDGAIGLSEPVRAAVGPAADLALSLARELAREVRADA